MVKLTIIIPHFNSVKTLDTLLRSIPDRHDIQVIVVDDQSDQHPQQFLAKEMLKRILLLDNTETPKGAGVCRNIGLQNAMGKWILFADADDWFIDGSLEVVSGFFDSDFDVVFFNATSVDKETGNLADRHIQIAKVIRNYHEIGDYRAELDLRYKIAVPWAKLINKSFLDQHQIWFDDVIASNDLMFSTKVGYNMVKFSVSQEVIYCATRSQDNLTMQSSISNFDARMNVFIERYRFLENNLDDEAFEILKLHGWFMVFYALRCRLGFSKALNTYRLLMRSGVKMWDYRYINPILLIQRLHNHYMNHRRTRKYINIPPEENTGDRNGGH